LNYYNDLPAFYNVSQISFNATSRQMKEGVNQRVFDVPACRRVVVTDWTRQLEQVMEPGKEVLAYRNGDDISELVNQALRDEAFRKKIAEDGYRRVIKEHTYVHRLNRLIDVMKKHYK
jgi:spore maturation protein CgeB